MQADSQTASAVKAVLDKIAQAYASRDLDLLRSTVASDADVIMYGTGADEKRVGLAEIELQAQRDWSQTESSEVRYGWMSISAAGNVAWAATDATFELTAGAEALSLPARITFVLERRGDRWLMVQSHFSFAATDQAEGESFPA
jgi:ketosteroid isomerase-like protein